MSHRPKIQKKARQLRALAAEAGAFLVAAEAEDILATSVAAIAAQLGISQRWELDRYVTDHYLGQFAAQLAAASQSYREATGAAEPVLLSAFQAARVLAALGMTTKLAASYTETHQAQALGIIHDGADTIVSISAALAGAQPGQGRSRSAATIWSWGAGYSTTRSASWTPAHGNAAVGPGTSLATTAGCGAR